MTKSTPMTLGRIQANLKEKANEAYVGNFYKSINALSLDAINVLTYRMGVNLIIPSWDDYRANPEETLKSIRNIRKEISKIATEFQQGRTYEQTSIGNIFRLAGYGVEAFNDDNND